MATYGATAAQAELEIALHRWDSESYAVELRFSRSDSDSDIAPMQGYARFDFEELRAQTYDAASYGKLLGASLFGQPELSQAFGTARDTAQAAELPLRIRLLINPGTPELQSLRWETLSDPRQVEVPLL